MPSSARILDDGREGTFFRLTNSYKFLPICIVCPNDMPIAVAKKDQTTGSFIFKIIAIPASIIVLTKEIALNSIDVKRSNEACLFFLFCFRFTIILGFNLIIDLI